MPYFMRSSRGGGAILRTLDVRPDDTDARDYIFQPSLRLLPATLDHRGYAPVLDQGGEGACVGFALATVINVSLNRRAGAGPRRRRPPAPWPVSVSPRMLYEIGKRYDEWAGEHYEGTSLRGAMKGWHKHGVTTERLWPYRLLRKGGWTIDRELTPERARDALRRPLGAYYRIVDSDISHVQAALVEGDAVLASAWVHGGWQHERLQPAGGRLLRIPRRPGARGLHAFAIVGYVPEGFIIQNSWGADWGSRGCALLGYDDWFENRQDAWVARPGPETRDSSGEPKLFVVGFGGGPGDGRAATAASGLDLDPRVLPFLINTGDRGALSAGGRLGTREDELPEMARQVLATPIQADGCRHVILYAHGGLVPEASATAVANRLWRLCHERRLSAYFFIWESGATESVLGWLRSDDDAAGPAGFSWQDAWERIRKGAGRLVREAQRALGAALAPVAREVFWEEMKGRAEGASTARGGAALFSRRLFEAMGHSPGPPYKLHLVAHSAGSLYLGWLYQRALRPLLAATPNVQVASIQLMAPAITIERARQAFAADGSVAVAKGSFRVYMLTERDEEQDSIQIYPSSLLTYIADHLEDRSGRIPLLGIRRDFDATGVPFATPVPAIASVRHQDFDEPGHEVDAIVSQIADLRC
jgi:hypothetical protein